MVVFSLDASKTNICYIATPVGDTSSTINKQADEIKQLTADKTHHLEKISSLESKVAELEKALEAMVSDISCSVRIVQLTFFIAS